MKRSGIGPIMKLMNLKDMLSDANYLIIKCWFHISKEEQLVRFKERAENPFKKWKLTEEDWRNRKKWDQYVVAVEKFCKKDKKYAPWHIISSNNKKYSLIETFKIHYSND